MTLEDKLLLVQAAVNEALTSHNDPVVAIQAGDAVARQAKFLSSMDIQRAFDRELADRLARKQADAKPSPSIPHSSFCPSVEDLRTDAPFLHPCSCVE